MVRDTAHEAPSLSWHLSKALTDYLVANQRDGKAAVYCACGSSVAALAGILAGIPQPQRDEMIAMVVQSIPDAVDAVLQRVEARNAERRASLN